jgi:hypothetical protein
MRLLVSLVALGALVALGLAACGGGNPLDNPPLVTNPPPDASGQKLSFEYFQRCINPIFLTPLAIDQNGVVSTNTCAGSGCHDNTNGTGGAFRVEPAAQPADLAQDADAIRATDMYRNFYSAQGEVVIGSPTQSRLLAKPLLLNVLHGGGRVFATEQDLQAQLIAYWITHPMPQGHDEFSAAADGLFDGNGECRTQ